MPILLNKETIADLIQKGYMKEDRMKNTEWSENWCNIWMGAKTTDTLRESLLVRLKHQSA